MITVDTKVRLTGDRDIVVPITLTLTREEYGADADGNRGVMQVEIYDIEYNSRYDAMADDIDDAIGKLNLEELYYEQIEGEREAYEEKMYKLSKEE